MYAPTTPSVLLSNKSLNFIATLSTNSSCVSSKDALLESLAGTLGLVGFNNTLTKSLISFSDSSV